MLVQATWLCVSWRRENFFRCLMLTVQESHFLTTLPFVFCCKSGFIFFSASRFPCSLQTTGRKPLGWCVLSGIIFWAPGQLQRFIASICSPHPPPQPPLWILKMVGFFEDLGQALLCFLYNHIAWHQNCIQGHNYCHQIITIFFALGTNRN